MELDDLTNNIYFTFEDLTFVVYKYLSTPKIRVFWKEFDSEWEMIAYKRTKRRLMRNLD